MEKSMKLKKFIINVMAVVMVLVSSLCFTACEDVVELEVKFSAYNYSAETAYSESEMTMVVKLHRNLAPKTVDEIVKHVNNSAYDNAVVYKFTDINEKQYMMGDLKFNENGEIEQILLPEIKGEFATNGVTGSNLNVTKGSIGLWRSYYACDGSMTVSSNARNTGRGTWFMPTEANSIYDGSVCVFGSVDLEDDVITGIYNAFAEIFSDEVRYNNYEIYYTGAYDETKADENYGLTFHCVSEEDFVEAEIEDLFKADEKKQQLAWFNHYTISVPVMLADGSQSLKIQSVKVI